MTITPGVEEIIRFLRRFADLVSAGHNADHLSRAADLIEALIKRVDDTEELLREEQATSEKNLRFYKMAETDCASLEKELAETRAKLVEQQSKSVDSIVNALAEQQRLLERAEQAETRLAAVENELAEAQLRLAAFDDDHVLVPVSTLRNAEALFAILAGEAADVVSQAMCEVGATTLDRIILESVAQSSDRTSKRAAA